MRRKKNICPITREGRDNKRRRGGGGGGGRGNEEEEERQGEGSRTPAG